MMTINHLMAAAAALAMAGCDTASVPMADRQADATAMRFDPPPPGKANLYIFRTGDVGTLVGVTVGARNLGSLGNYSFFVLAVDPGSQQVRCVGGEDSKAVTVAIADGETRFVSIDAVTGWWAARCRIAEAPDIQGRAGVMQGHLAAMLQ